MMKINIIFYGPTQIPYLGKSGFENMGQTGIGQSDCRIFKSTIYLQQNHEIA